MPGRYACFRKFCGYLPRLCNKKSNRHAHIHVTAIGCFLVFTSAALFGSSIDALNNFYCFSLLHTAFKGQ